MRFLLARQAMAAKRAVIVGAGIAAATLTASAVAWACTAHTGAIWFCTSSAGCNVGSSQTVWSVGATNAWVDGDGLKKNKTMTVHYAPALVDAACMTGVEMAVIETNGSGDVITPQQVTMPLEKGDWKACAITTSTDSGTDVVISSEHSGFTTI